MPAASTSAINPTSGDPGQSVTLTGADFAAGAVVEFRGQYRTVTVVGSVVSAAEISARVPTFDGLADALDVVVINPGQVASNAQGFALNAWPPVQTTRPLCSLAAVKQQLQIDARDNGADEHLLGLIETASAQIANECRRSFGEVLTIADELHDGDGSAILQPKETPIVAVSELWIDDIEIPSTDYAVYPETVKLMQGEEYSARLRGVQRLFGQGRQNVSISYTAGYAQIPALLAKAAVLQTLYLRNTIGRIGIRSESNTETGFSTSFYSNGLAPQVQVIASQFKRRKVRLV